MTDEELKLIEDIKELNETWKIKKELIKKEGRKRIYCFALIVFFDMSAVILQLLKITNIVVSLSVLTICLIAGLAHNNYIAKRIKKIILTDDIKELRIELEK